MEKNKEDHHNFDFTDWNLDLSDNEEQIFKEKILKEYVFKKAALALDCYITDKDIFPYFIIDHIGSSKHVKKDPLMMAIKFGDFSDYGGCYNFSLRECLIFSLEDGLDERKYERNLIIKELRALCDKYDV